MRMSTGDRKPDLELTLKSKKDNVDATAAPTVRMIGTRDGAIVIDVAPTSSALGSHEVDGVELTTTILTYEWADGDTNTVGLITWEVEVTWPLNKKQTFECDDVVEIEADADA